MALDLRASRVTVTVTGVCVTVTALYRGAVTVTHPLTPAIRQAITKDQP